METIKNTPVLGFIKYNKVTQENDFKGHEYILTKTENGIEEKYIGSCFGVIPESCNPRWITKMCDDGQERDFVQVDALLWTKFEDSISIMERDSEKQNLWNLNCLLLKDMKMKMVFTILRNLSLMVVVYLAKAVTQL